MVYIYKKKIGNKFYYYLRGSIKKGNKYIIKDIAYLGNDLKQLKNKIQNFPQKYSKEIRKTYKTINKFLESNHYLQKVKEKKLKKIEHIKKENLEKIESCKLHWNQSFQKLDKLTKQEILESFLIEFAFNTTSIEGNTITLQETKKLLEDNLTPKNRTLREIYDLQNTKEVFFNLLKSKRKLSNTIIQEIHKNLLEKIDERTGYRTRDVRVIGMRFKSTPAPYVKADMDILLRWYIKNEKKLHPFILATLFHHKFEKIHPFGDGNGRVGRILMNYILMQKSYPPLIIRKKNRKVYLTELNMVDRCDLDKTEVRLYVALINFLVRELNGTYWNAFL